MKIQDLIYEIYSVFWSNKVRSGLTVLGIVIGIASVVAMISIGQGASYQIQSSIESLGSNLLTIIPGFVQPGRGIVSSGRGSAQTLVNDDLEIIEKIPGVIYLSPELQRRFQVVAGTNNTNTTVIGVAPDYFQVRNMSIALGSYIVEPHLRGLERVAVLGSTVASDLFGEGVNPIGKSIYINKTNFRVIGVLEPKGSVGFFDPNDTILVPLTTMQKILAGVDYLSIIAVGVESKDLISQVQEEITLALSRKHRVDPQNPDFSIVSQSDIIGTLTQVANTFTIFLAAVAGISLLVGGIGIMNMMLTTVTERTREIGLRRAIGAKRKDISLQFLLESIALTFIGGVLGIILGWAIAVLVSNFAGITTKVSIQAIFLSFGVSAAIGVVFGYYPAKKAASLNPIEALRYE
ncbi:MAG: ABC transporter permease [Patescibacteria group bacterium]|nr:ABC transporter permease [Patescibacteria group bacterium]